MLVEEAAKLLAWLPRRGIGTIPLPQSEWSADIRYAGGGGANEKANALGGGGRADEAFSSGFRSELVIVLVSRFQFRCTIVAPLPPMPERDEDEPLYPIPRPRPYKPGIGSDRGTSLPVVGEQMGDDGNETCSSWAVVSVVRGGEGERVVVHPPPPPPSPFPWRSRMEGRRKCLSRKRKGGVSGGPLMLYVSECPPDIKADERTSGAGDSAPA